jgi:hypothetical protein
MTRLAIVAALAALLLLPSSPRAQVPDHLKCYKVKDTQAKAQYTATLDGLSLEAGCTIKVPAQLLCVPATKTNVIPAPPGGGATGTPNTFACYKAKCPKTPLAPINVSDQFGTRSVAPSIAKLLCAPSASTTTTTTTTGPTTTLPFCGVAIAPECNGDCLGGVCVFWPDFNICTCV